MRKLFAALAITVASLALFEGCAPIPLPHYAAYRPRRVEELPVDSENMRQAGDERERFWLLDQPSHLTPFRTHGGAGPRSGEPSDPEVPRLPPNRSRRDAG